MTTLQDSVALVPLRASRLIAYLAGFQHVAQPSEPEWRTYRDYASQLDELASRWPDDEEERVISPVAQVEVDCPQILLEEATVDTHRGAFRSVLEAARKEVQCQHGGELEFELLVPAIATAEGPRLVVVVRERWRRRLNGMQAQTARSLAQLR